jgi:hypothetical protein
MPDRVAGHPQVPEQEGAQRIGLGRAGLVDPVERRQGLGVHQRVRIDKSTGEVHDPRKGRGGGRGGGLLRAAREHGEDADHDECRGSEMPHVSSGGVKPRDCEPITVIGTSPAIRRDHLHPRTLDTPEVGC